MQHFGKVNAKPGLVVRQGDLLASAGSSWKVQLPPPQWYSRLPVEGKGSPSCHGGISDCRVLQPALLTTLITWLMENGLEGVGGDSCAPAQLLQALAESHIYPSGHH